EEIIDEEDTVEVEEEIVEENEEEEEEVPTLLSLSDILSKTLVFPNCSEEIPSFSMKEEERPKIKPTVSTSNSSLGVLVNDMVDMWEEALLPFVPSSISIFNDALICTVKGKNPRWLPINLLAHSKSTWSNAKWKADTVVANDAIVVRCDGSIAYLLTTDISPSNSQWLKMNTKKIGGLALNSRDAWMIVEGGVDLLMGINHESIHHHVECEWRLVSIAVKDDAVWAISEEGSLIVRVGFTKNRRFGEDWVEVSSDRYDEYGNYRLGCLRPDGPSALQSIALHGDSAFVLDDTYTVWRAEGVNEYTPFGTNFYRICTPLDAISYGSIPSIPLLSVSSKGLFLTVGKRLIYSSSPLSGHRFVSQISSSLSSLDDFSLVSAGSHSMDQSSVGVFLQLRATSEIFNFRPQISFSLHPFPFGSDLQTIDKVTHLSSSGRRSILADGNGKCLCVSDGIATVITIPFEIDSLALSEVLTWILTKERKAMISLEFPPLQWKEVAVEGKAERIFSSPNGRYVWIVSEGRAFAREGIRITNLIGGRWVKNEFGPALNSLAVGNSIIFGLSQEGRLYRLRKLSAVNVKGCEWSLVSPSHFFSSLSLDSDSTLWLTTREGRLIKHEISIYRTP
ncbi:hypothetical protein PFISCL1PPCAC_2406, partial [Pristionchus fissidentatus]